MKTTRRPSHNPHRRGILIAFGVTVLTAVLFYGYQSGFFFESGLTPCSPPPGYMVDGEATGAVQAWVDQNGNGVRDAGEPALPGVRALVMASAGQDVPPTGADGLARFAVFRPGCACDCNKGVTIQAVAPQGYSATTPLTQPLAKEGETVGFGFKPAR